MLVFDNDMRRKLLPDLDGLRIVKVADIVYEGHMFAFNEENNLIAANLKYLCKGCPPYLVKDFSKLKGGSNLSIKQQNIVLLHASGEVQKILISPFSGTINLE